MSEQKIMLLLPLTVALSACNHGGSSTPAAATTPVSPTDATAPTVSSTNPATAAIGVARNSTLTATFDEDIFASTVDGSSFTLAASGAVAGSVSFNGATNVASFAPTHTLLPLTTYTATLSTAITDLSGNALAAPYSWNFTTADGAWGTAATIEVNDGAVFGAEIAADPNGNAIAIWIQHDGTSYSVWANRYTAGSGWGTATTIESDNGVAYFYPRIAMDVDGNALAVWQQHDGTRNNIWANRYTAGSGWGTATLLETDNAGAAQLPQVVIDANGDAIAVWQQSDGTRNNIWSNRYTVGSGWGTATLIENDTEDTSGPQIAVDATGNALAVWSQHDGVQYNLWANRYTAGSGWGTAALIEANNGNAQRAQIAMDASGNALAVWDQYDGSRLDIWSNRYTAGSGWGTAALIETDNAGDAQYPQIAVDASGNAFAVWWQSNGSRLDIWSNRYTAGAGWGTAGLIETDDAGDAASPQIGFDAGGNAFAIWSQSDGTQRNIQAKRYIVGSGWGTPALIESDTGNAIVPRIAVNPSGNVFAVWQQHDGTRENIRANIFE